jgi:L-asparaginase
VIAPMTEPVHVVFTGGTIASQVDTTGSEVASVSGDDLLARVPGLAEVADLSAEQYGNVSGNNLTLSDMFAIGQRACDLARHDDVAGVVVVQGTATLEESAYYAELLLDSPTPIVYTGAMYSASHPDSDGPRNILNAVRLAAAPEAREMGVLVCLNSEIHAARDVAKTHSTQVDTFSSYEHGTLGTVDPDRIVIYRRPVLRRTFDVDHIEPKVDLIKVVADMDDRFVRFSAESGAAAIVIEGLPGTGGVTRGVIAAVRDVIAGGTPVVVTTRCNSGRVFPVYGGGPGSKDMADAGCIMAGDLAPAKARILLTVALAETRDVQELRAIFAEVAP